MEEAYICAYNSVQRYYDDIGKRLLALHLAQLRTDMIQSAVNWKAWKIGPIDIRVRVCFGDAMKLLNMDADKEVATVLAMVRMLDDPAEDKEAL